MRADHVRREVGRRDLHADLQREQVRDQAPVPGHARRPGHAVRERRGLDQRVRLALVREQPRRPGARETRRGEQRRETVQVEAAVLAEMEDRPAREQPEQHRDLADARASREEPRAHAARDERPDPGRPRGPGRHARRPVEGRDQEQPERRQRAVQRRRAERDEARGLEQRAQHDPAPVRAEPAHAPGRNQLQHGARQERTRGRVARDDVAQPERQRERGDVGLAGTDHDAGGDGVGVHQRQVPAQHGGFLRERSAPAARAEGAEKRFVVGLAFHCAGAKAIVSRRWMRIRKWWT